MSGKTYASNSDLGLNSNGIRPQPVRKGSIPPSAPGSCHHICNEGGWIKPTKEQVGWRVRVAQVGTCGGYEITVGAHIHKFVLPGMVDQVDFTIDVADTLRVEQFGMLSNDWGALVVSKF